MNVKTKFAKNNLLHFIIIIEIVYTLAFFIFYLIGLHKQLTPLEAIKIMVDEPALILIILHPFFLWIILNANTKRNTSKIEALEAVIEANNTKIEEVYKFIESLRQGDTKYQFKSTIKQDKLVKSILNLRDELEKSRLEEEQRKKEEQQRHWTNEGLAKFGAILRENIDNLEVLASKVTSNLTRYLNAQQAGFFFIKEEDGEKYIDMLALFAFERKKFPDKRFKWGEGLIGACALEKKTIFLDQTSDGFVDITSGLGKANPRSILIVPIKDNDDNIHGVLELASFKIFEDYEINFVELVAESIGMTIASIKINLRTQELLRESQKQAELLAQQEANMRANIQEIDDLRKKAEEQLHEELKFKETVEKFIIYAQIDKNGFLKAANDIFKNIMEFGEDEDITQIEFSSLMPIEDKTKFEQIWANIFETKEKSFFELKFITRQNQIKYVSAFIAPFLDNDNNIDYVGFFALETTTEARKSRYAEQLIESYEHYMVALELDKDAQIIDYNETFEHTFEYIGEEIKSKTIFELMPESDVEDFKVIFGNIYNGRKYRAKKQFKSKTGKDIVLDTLFLPLYDIDNQIVAVKMVAIDISEYELRRKSNKEMEEKIAQLQEQLEILNKETSAKLEKTKKETAQQYAEKIFKADVFDNLFDNIDSAVVLAENQTIIFYNKKAEELWGFRKEIAIGKKLKYLFPIDNRLIDDENYLGNNLEQKLQKKEQFILDKELQQKKVVVSTLEFKVGIKKITGFILATRE